MGLMTALAHVTIFCFAASYALALAFEILNLFRPRLIVRVLANVLTGSAPAYPGSLLATNLKVSGVPVFSAGDFEGQGAEQIVVSDSSAPSYRKLVVRDGKLAGVVLAGDTTDALWYLELIRSGAEITARRPTLAFGRAYSEAA